MISPDPVTKNSVITIETPLKTDLILLLVDRSGKTVYRSEITLSEGKNVIPIGDQGLASGEYSCILTSGRFRKIVNFIVQ